MSTALSPTHVTSVASRRERMFSEERPRETLLFGQAFFVVLRQHRLMRDAGLSGSVLVRDVRRFLIRIKHELGGCLWIYDVYIQRLYTAHSHGRLVIYGGAFDGVRERYFYHLQRNDWAT